MRYEIRELTVSGILDQAVAVTRDHFWLFLKIMLVLLVPFSVVTGLLTVWNMPEYSQSAPPDVMAQRLEQAKGAVPMLVAIWVLSMLVVYPLTDAAIIYAVANCYLDRPSTVSSAFGRRREVFFPLIGTAMLAYLIIFGGILLFIIPGLIFAFRYMLCSRVVIIEGLSGSTALKRSRQLMNGNVGTAVLLGIIVAIISYALGFIRVLVPQRELGLIVASVLQAGLFIFTSATWVVFYFSCRCKVENFDLVLLADAISTNDPAPE